LEDFCTSLSESQAELLRSQIAQVSADPSGRRAPQHRLTRPFRPTGKLALPKGQRAFEFKTNHVRGLFIVDTVLRELVFIPVVKGRRFVTAAEAPWHS
jgi:hypothetical protein